MQKQLSIMTPKSRKYKLGAMNSSPTRTYSRIGLFRNLELITTSSVLSWLSFKRFLHIQRSISSTQRSIRNFASSRSAQQLVLKEIYSCVSSAYRWYNTSCFFDDISNRRSVNKVQQWAQYRPLRHPTQQGRLDEPTTSGLDHHCSTDGATRSDESRPWELKMLKS